MDSSSIELKDYIRDIPDFPKPGILFRDITPLLSDHRAFRETVNRFAEQYRDKPLETPMFTHSCNRYFRPCSMIDLCTAAKDDQYIMFDTMVDEQALSPSEQKAMMRNM